MLFSTLSIVALAFPVNCFILGYHAASSDNSLPALRDNLSHLQGQRNRVADKSSTRSTSRCILFDGENISFDASLVIYIYK